VHTWSLSDRRRYPSDLTDGQWRVLESMIPPEKHGGRHREVDVREVVNAILYVLRTGCPGATFLMTILRGGHGPLLLLALVQGRDVG
jgi:Putative transposase of IS4/5 family (DUF4096)